MSRDVSKIFFERIEKFVLDSLDESKEISLDSSFKEEIKQLNIQWEKLPLQRQYHFKVIDHCQGKCGIIFVEPTPEIIERLSAEYDSIYARYEDKLFYIDKIKQKRDDIQEVKDCPYEGRPFKILLEYYQRVSDACNKMSIQQPAQNLKQIIRFILNEVLTENNDLGLLLKDIKKVQTENYTMIEFYNILKFKDMIHNFYKSTIKEIEFSIDRLGEEKGISEEEYKESIRDLAPSDWSISGQVSLKTPVKEKDSTEIKYKLTVYSGKPLGVMFQYCKKLSDIVGSFDTGKIQNIICNLVTETIESCFLSQNSIDFILDEVKLMDDLPFKKNLKFKILIKVLDIVSQEIIRQEVTTEAGDYDAHSKNLELFEQTISRLDLDWQYEGIAKLNVPKSSKKSTLSSIEYKGNFISIIFDYYKDIIKKASENSIRGIGDIFYFLIKCAEKDDKIFLALKANEQTYREDRRMKWIGRLLDSLQLTKEDKVGSGIQPERFPVRWVSSLDIVYGRRTSCFTPRFLTEKDHLFLKSLTEIKELQAQALTKTVKGNPNIAYAGISLIVKDPNVDKTSPNYIRRLYLPLADEESRAQAVSDEDHKQIYERIRKAELLDPQIQTTKRRVGLEFSRLPKEVKEIGDLNKTDDKQKHHHTEQKIYNFIEQLDNLRNILQDFKKEISALSSIYIDDFRQLDEEPFKILAFIVHIHSVRYMCENCQIASIGFQHPDHFKLKLRDIVSSEFKKTFEIPEINKLAVLILVSTHQAPKMEKPKKDGKKKAEKRKRKTMIERPTSKVPEVGHLKAAINIKFFRGDKIAILAKDTRIGFSESYSPFYSRYAVKEKYDAKFPVPKKMSDDESDSPSPSLDRSSSEKELTPIAKAARDSGSPVIGKGRTNRTHDSTENENINSEGSKFVKIDK